MLFRQMVKRPSPDDDQPDIKEAVRQVDEITDSEPVNGEELLESEELKRQLREAKEREARRPAKGAKRP